jgi:hypothetical protein
MRSDQTTHFKIVETLRAQINNNENYIKELNKEIKREKRKKRLTVGVGIVLIGAALLL